MVKKELDKRITSLIRNGVQEKKRSFFIIVGDRAKDVIVHLHYILSHVDIKQNRSVLWAYKHKLIGFTSHRKKREAKIKKEVKRGIREANSEDPFELFVSSQDIRYVYYKETEKILGNTYGMCILQDFEAITPNLLARTVETVEGGGLVIMLLKTMTSLKQLYTMSMDVHSRYRTEAHGDVVARFNERFILSLGDCQSCLVIDDEMNVLPISGARHVKQLPPVSADSEKDSKSKKELDAVKELVADVQPTASLVNLARTADQAQALLTFVKAITEKTLRSTVTLTAGRGRGKSAALGVAIAAAVAYGYSNIFITSPSPENLKTLFQFIFKGFDALGYTDHLDYNIVQSTNPDFNKAIVRVNIFKQHRQTIQYIQPADAHVLGQAELVVIDEAAAIPLPLVRKLLGPYLVFMASTINGYEGTGRSLSLKLIQQLREQSRNSSKTNGAGKAENGVPGTRQLQEIVLNEPIRYAPGDAVEDWLNKLLCLNATLPRKSNIKGCPHPDECQLYNVNRDTLFSYNRVCEAFLQNMMALYVASHYKNSPNDLQLMSDAPAHQLFVLLPPINPESKEIPEPLCVIQVALEGQISKQSVLNQLGRGQRADGDLIPWLVTQQYQDEDFATLSGARVVRIATNPEYTKMGYGSRALRLLEDFYEGKFASLDENAGYIDETMVRVTDEELESTSLTTDKVQVREMNAMPPLLLRLHEKRAEELDYLGVSYGLTNQLHRFWKKAGFAPVYLRQTANELTGEHTCVMLKTLAEKDRQWLGAFAKDFHKRFINLLAYQFRLFPAVQSLSIMESASSGGAAESAAAASAVTKAQLDELFSPFDLKRLESYANNMLDHHVITDMVPLIATLYFTNRLPVSVKLSGVQSAILLAIGLQKKTTDDIEKELNVQNQQILAMFVKIMKKVSTALGGVVERAIEEELPPEHHGRQKVGAEEAIDEDGDEIMVTSVTKLKPLEQSLDDDIEEGADEVKIALKEKQRELINALDLQKFEIPSASADWEDAERQVTGGTGGGKSSTVSVKSSKQVKRKAGESAAEIYEQEMNTKPSSKKKKK
ncbi:UPF0202 protein KRE33 [Drechslerella stenobrocha 248]|uniref:RNA cytidine acetyltransferase n=1 Tax=Drechslerella stenobrocha 248 TaxID=1043628 RepID=W7HPT8_9PEZI|nr:UPF0202 protein KRE33 [Drechslerella stenobrocha 248]